MYDVGPDLIPFRNSSFPRNRCVFASDRLNHCQSIANVPCEAAGDNIVIYARSRHAGGVNTVLTDGSVRFVSNTVEAATWTNLGTRASSDMIGSY